MWETSKRPAAWRTAMCSEMRPAYSTGISQPPKGTIFAPISRWTACSGVLRRVVVVDSTRLLMLSGTKVHATTRRARGSTNGVEGGGDVLYDRREVARSPSSDTYLAICWNCLGEFDALNAVWCSHDAKNPTK